jgi:hypothetical protein
MYKTIAESNSFIVLDNFTRYNEANEAPAAYQTEAALEIALRKKQYEYYRDLVLDFNYLNIGNEKR